MKNFLNLNSIAIALIASLVMTSCAHSDQVVTNNLIQKRKYNKGYFVNFGKDKKQESAIASKDKSAEVVSEKSESSVASVKANNAIAPNTKTLTASANKEVEVVSKTKTVNQDQSESTPIEANVYTSKRVQKVIEKAQKAQKEKNLEEASNSNAPAAAADDGKSQIIALVLCALVGGIGIHRFYLGYTWQGIVQLLTFGACGVWTLIDLIRIITGDLGPKSGRYTKTL